MLINDYSQQDWTSTQSDTKISLTEILTAGVIFVVPVIFLILISAN